MSASVLESPDLNWVVGVLKQRRELLVELVPVFWRPASDASASHRAYIEYLLSEGDAKGFRTGSVVLLAAPRGEGWLIDDMYAPGLDWADGDGRNLWKALDGAAHGAQVRFVCPAYERERADFARAVELVVTESWWLLELPDGPTGGEAGVRVHLAGTEAITVTAPPVYDPGGPVLSTSPRQVMRPGKLSPQRSKAHPSSVAWRSWSTKRLTTTRWYRR